jgi:DNA repair exonuclease SbcCD ATPase subunit
MLKAMELDEDKISQIIDAHQATVDEIAKERDSYKADAEKYKSDSEELAPVKKELAAAQKELEKLKGIDDEFSRYKADVAAKTTQAAKEKAYREVLKEAGVSEKRFDAIIKVSDLSKIELDDDGHVKDSKDLVDGIKTEWAEFIVTEGQKGASTATPPSNTGGTKMSKDEIMQIKDTAERQQAMLDNKELFLN